MTTQAAAPWTCPQCNHTNRPGSRFCSRCRTPNPYMAGPAPEPVPAGGGTQRIDGGASPVAGGEAEIAAAGRLLVETVGTVPQDGLEQWMMLRYQQLPALN